MAYTRVTRAVDGAAALAYVLNGKGHNGKGERNRLVTLVNLRSGVPVKVQMQVYWSKAKSNHIIQIIRIVQSFSRNEFDPDNPEDVLKANEIGQAMVEEHFPNRQAVVCTQTDGKSGLIHNHVFINDVSMLDYKGCEKWQYKHQILMNWTDEITSRYTVLDYGSRAHEKLTQTERAIREKNEKADKEGVSGKHEYSYKDDIRDRVRAAMKLSLSEEEFIEKLSEAGVNTVKRRTKQHGEYYTYELVSGVPADAKLPNHPLKARSYNLGTDFEPGALKDCIEINERVIVRNEFTSFDEYSSYESGFEKTASAKGKNETEERSEMSLLNAVPAAPVPDSSNENLRQLLLGIDREEEEEEQKEKQIEEQNSKKTAHNPPHEKSRKKPKFKRKSLFRKAKKDIDRNRFNRTFEELRVDEFIDKDREDFERK
ncbi:MAG: relaxase/mobilization nuclease domain-containing protein [Ruminiclostridium sp.]